MRLGGDKLAPKYFTLFGNNKMRRKTTNRMPSCDEWVVLLEHETQRIDFPLKFENLFAPRSRRRRWDTLNSQIKAESGTRMLQTSRQLQTKKNCRKLILKSCLRSIWVKVVSLAPSNIFCVVSIKLPLYMSLGTIPYENNNIHEESSPGCCANFRRFRFQNSNLILMSAPTTQPKL